MRETRKNPKKKEERKTEKGVPDFGVILAHRQTDKNNFSTLEIDKSNKSNKLNQSLAILEKEW